jgi:hypothetical protein
MDEGSSVQFHGIEGVRNPRRSGLPRWEVKPVKLFVKARDPSDGATVMVICLTSREALGAVQILRQECFESIGITDSRGTAVFESVLAIEPSDHHSSQLYRNDYADSNKPRWRE